MYVIYVKDGDEIIASIALMTYNNVGILEEVHREGVSVLMQRPKDYKVLTDGARY